MVKVTSKELLESAILMGSVKLVKDPQLIKVSTISPKVVEQLPQLDTSDEWANELSRRTDFSKMEIIGVSVKTYNVVVREESGQLGKIRTLSYLTFLQVGQQMDLNVAQSIVHELPQLFEV